MIKNEINKKLCNLLLKVAEVTRVRSSCQHTSSIRSRSGLQAKYSKFKTRHAFEFFRHMNSVESTEFIKYFL